jgi:hypothetical protein
VFRIASLVLAGLVLVAAVADAADEQKGPRPIKLFNGKNLDGWQCHLVEPDVKMEDVWSVEDGILVCKGEPFGFLHTKEKYTNFRLIVEWRWAGEEPGNSGVLLRVTGDPPSFLAKCVEAQLKHGDAGDIWAFYGFEVAGAKDRFVDIEHDVLGRLKGVRKIKDAEKPAGEWNKYVITLKGDKLNLVINGEKVNQARGLTVEPGTIGLQSEGGEIHFRTVRLVPLDE